MKIAQIAPLYESVPPRFYGGTERIVFYLTEELLRQGHEVTLFASGDSFTSGELVPVVKEALRLRPDCVDPLAPHIVEIQEIAERAHEFDIIHFHIDYLHFPFTAKLSTPVITTLHGRLDIPELKYVYRKFKQPVVSISYDQRKSLPEANFAGTVYHGLPPDHLKQGSGAGNYLAFLGRISPEKGLDKAIEWAIAANMPLKIAAKVDKADREYFEKTIKPLLDHPLVEYIGEIDETRKQAFLGDALALLFPINWNEPFGIVMIEAMACGTPVIAHGMGSVPEVLEQGRSGYMASSTDEALAAIGNIQSLSRDEIRRAFERRFTAAHMAGNYLRLYQQLISERQPGLHLIEDQVHG
jgi:glycosyltransferase involved in cell wall biosynthesis